MEQHLFDFLGKHPGYVAVGAIIVGIFLVNEKARRYFGKIFTLASILLLLAVVYMIATRGEKQEGSPSLKAGTKHEEQRKSIYYKDPEEELRQSGVNSDRRPH